MKSISHPLKSPLAMFVLQLRPIWSGTQLASSLL